MFPQYAVAGQQLFFVLCFCVISLFQSSLSFSQSFKTQQVTPGRLHSVYKIDNAVAYAGGLDGIFKTVDGGQTWSISPYFQSTLTTVDSNYYLTFNKIHLQFLDPLTGYAAGWSALCDCDVIMKTQNGALTWDIQRYLTPDDHHPQFHGLNDLFFLNESKGFAVGNYGRLLMTTNGGGHWEEIDISGLLDTSLENNLSFIQFVSDQNGFTGGSGLFLKTSNGGSTWERINVTGSLKDIFFFNTTTGFAVTDAGEILKTSDGGNTWTASLFKSAFPLTSVLFVDANTGFVTGGYEYGKGIIYKTTDGGLTWLSVLESANGIMSSSFVNSLNGAFSDYGGNIIQTTDGGTRSTSKPVLSSFTPLSGMEGDIVKISGSGLNNVTGVSFNDIPAKYTYDNGIVETEVPDATSGKITLVWPGGTVTSTQIFEFSLKPVITTPTPHYHTRGFPLVIDGRKLQYITEAKMGSRTVSLTINSDQQITIPVEPDLPQETYTITLTSAYGSASLPVNITGMPKVNDVRSEDYSPRGYYGGNVVIAGLSLSSATAVEFNGISAPFTITSQYQINTSVPVGATTGPVKVHTPFGVVKSSVDFEIAQPPVIDSIRPQSVLAGERVTLYGKNLSFPDRFTTLRHGSSYLDNLYFEYIDDHQIVFLAPSNPFTGAVTINAIGGNAVSTDQLTISGTLPMGITSISPQAGEWEVLVTVKGIFPYPLDSAKIGNVKVSVNQTARDFLTFRVPEGAVSGKVSLFKGGTALTSDAVFLVTDLLPPTITAFEPKVTTPGSNVGLNGNIGFEDVVEFTINGLRIPYDTDVLGSWEFLLKIPAAATTGKIKIKTKYGEYTTTEDLVIRAHAAPVIRGVDSRFDPMYGNVARIWGDNFADVDTVRFDHIPASFAIRNNDTLLVPVPDIGLATTTKVIVSSPYGYDAVNYEISDRLHRKIIAISPARARPGSTVLITFEPMKDYNHNSPEYEDDINAFYFNGISQRRYQKVDDDHYVVDVPVEGDVNGKVGAYYYASQAILYSDLHFTATYDEYCGSKGTNTQYAGICGVAFGALRNTSAFAAYSDFTSKSIDVIPGQRLTLEVRSSLTSHATLNVKVLIDWNNDFDFEDAGEEIMNSGDATYAFVNDTLVLYKAVNIPSTLVGEYSTRMRIICNFFPSAEVNFRDIQGCGLTNYGEMEDYTVNVKSLGNALALTDFYPKTTISGSSITLVGNFNSIAPSDITIGGIQVTNFNPISNTMIEVPLPDGVTSGKIVLRNAAAESVESFTTLTIDDGLPAMEPTSFNNIYRATLNDQDIAVYLNTANAHPNPAPVFPLFPGDAENGTFCIYGGSGMYCYGEANTFPPVITSFTKESGGPGQKVVIKGNYFHQVSEVTFNGKAASFVVIDLTTLEAVVPATATTGKITVTTANGSSSGDTDFEVYNQYCVHGGQSQITDIVKVQTNTFTHVSALQPDIGYSDFTKFELHASAGETMVIAITLRGAYPISYRRMPVVYVDWNNDLDLNGEGERFEGEWISMAYYEEGTGIVHVKIPDAVPAGTRARMRIIQIDELNVLQRDVDPIDPCFSAGEMEDYTLIVQGNDEAQPALSISGFSPSAAMEGAAITLTGTNFSAIQSVTLNGLKSEYTVVNNTTITFKVPAGAVSGKIAVAGTYDEALSATAITINQSFAITSFSPISGRAGDEIIIKGSNLSMAKSVWFGQVETVDFVRINSTQIRVKVPTGAGDGYIALKNASGATVVSASMFYYCDGYTASAYCRMNQVVHFYQLAPIPYSIEPVKLVAIASSGLQVSFTSSDTNILEILEDDAVTKAIGSAEITAGQSGNALYYPASVSRPIQITKSLQAITFVALPGKVYKDSPFALSASSNAGLPISFSSSNSQVASVSGNMVTIKSAGSVIITASQPGNSNVSAATPVDRTLVISKANQVLSFQPLASKVFGNAPFTLTGSSDSGLSVAYKSSNTTVATVVNNTVTIVGAGSTTITASQNGNTNFNAALSIGQELLVDKASQSILFQDIPDIVISQQSFQVQATSTAGLPVSFTALSSKISVTGNVVQLLVPGRAGIEASQAGNTNYGASSAVQKTFCIIPAKPAIAVSDQEHDLAMVLTSSSSVGNRWYFNGELLATSSQSITADESGSYTVQVVVEDCPASEMSVPIDVSITGLEEDAAELVQVHPVPVNDILNISTPWPVYNISIFDAQGMELRSIVSDKQQYSLSMKEFPQGLYYLEIQVSGKNYFKRVLKL